MNVLVPPIDSRPLTAEFIKESEQLFKTFGIARGSYRVFFQSLMIVCLPWENPANELNDLIQKLVQRSQIDSEAGLKILSRHVTLFYNCVLHMMGLHETDREKFDALLAKAINPLSDSHGGSPEEILYELADIGKRVTGKAIALYTDCKEGMALKDIIKKLRLSLSEETVVALMAVSMYENFGDKSKTDETEKLGELRSVMTSLVVGACGLDQAKRKKTEA